MLQYLLSPTFQFVNSAGRPATGGWIEVYIHGTRTQYYCSSDFDGTLLPFKIPLDSIGANIVLADDANSYDVYAYNRYGSLLMSRYNVSPGSGGGGGGISTTSIVSTDGSITVTNTADGVDLSVTHQGVSVFTGLGRPRVSDGRFDVVQLQNEGEHIHCEQQTVTLDSGWYHVAACFEIDWDAEPQNTTQEIVLSVNGLMTQVEMDLTHPHDESLTVAGDIKALVDGQILVPSVSGLPVGVVAKLTSLSVHSLVDMGGTVGEGSAHGRVHRLLRWFTNAAEADENHPVGDWLHDFDAEDPEDPSGHPMVTADQLFEWFGEGQNFELYEVDGRNGQMGWSAIYRMVTWQDQSDWWSQYAPEPGKACRIEFHRMGGYSSVNYAMMIAYIRYKDEKYMRLYEIMPGQSVWIMELQPKLPYYGRDTHNGELLRVMEDGSGLEWYNPVTTRTVTVGD